MFFTAQPCMQSLALWWVVVINMEFIRQVGKYMFVVACHIYRPRYRYM